MNSLDFFQKGGPVMYILFLCSLTVIAISIDRFIYYRQAVKDKSEFQTGLEKILLQKTVPEAIAFCKNFSNAFSFVAMAGLKAYKKGNDVEQALDSTYSMAAMKLRERINYLSVVVTLAPLLGLLGTIFGMIQSFSIFNVQAGQPLAITGGIGEALIATATGLCVAVLSLLAHTYYSQRLDTILTDLEQTYTIVLNCVPKQTMPGGSIHETT
ncbi:MotA/TolQ/ExbB proton channel family protein [Propionispira raffinosivorans]|uniref:MotA/TolQ/ExbB proton channel family protein n=1 Tax=Propionispira raffinosivorans TaxID=86959 RepID=UPI000375B4F2|nr:MotA/TolQ/ExbB proton channel family protein [Propionispira raffinosivorans]